MSRALLTRAALPRFLRVRFDLEEFEVLLKLGREAWRIKDAELTRRSLPRSLPPRSRDSSSPPLPLEDEEQSIFCFDVVGGRWNNQTIDQSR